MRRFLWGASAVFQGVYALLQRLNMPLIVQPHLFGFLCFVSWGQVGCLIKPLIFTAHVTAVPILWGRTLTMGGHRLHHISHHSFWSPRIDSSYHTSTAPRSWRTCCNHCDQGLRSSWLGYHVRSTPSSILADIQAQGGHWNILAIHIYRYDGRGL